MVGLTGTLATDDIANAEAFGAFFRSSIISIRHDKILRKTRELREFSMKGMYIQGCDFGRD